MEGPRWGDEGYSLARHVAGRLAYRAVQMVAVLLAITTLFFLFVRVSPSPSSLLAGAGASQTQMRSAGLSYGLDGPIWSQYLTFIGRAARLEFGRSPVHKAAALQVVGISLPATLLLAATVIASTAVVAVALGVWLGLRAGNPGHAWAFRLLLTAQSLPALVAGLVLFQVFGLTVSPGAGGPLRFTLAAATLTWWLVPRAARLMAGAVADASRQAWMLTARAMGATSRQLLWDHVLPSSLLGALALLGVEVAFIFSAAVVVEWLFGWPGVGGLLAGSVRSGDFPVMQAAVFVIAMVVFVAYAAVDVVVAVADPRYRRAPGAS